MTSIPAAVIGWTVSDSRTYNYLLYAKVRLIPGKVCNNSLNRLCRFQPITITPTSTCVKSKLDVTVTDLTFASGSLLLNEENLLGLTSWGNVCGEIKWPGIYVDLKTMMEWIKEVTNIKNISLKLV